MLQVVATYFLSALLKSGDEWRADGTALYFALGVGHFVRPTADLIYPHYELLRVLTHATFWLEAVGSLLVFSPFETGKIRIAAVAAFWGFHLGILFFMELGVFPLVCMAAWLIFLPTAFWDTSERLVGRVEPFRRLGRSVQVLARRAAGLLYGPTEHTPRPWTARRLAIDQVLAGSALSVVVLWNIGTLVPALQVPQSFRPIAWMLRIDQRWGMFAPYPRKVDAWTVSVAHLSDGSKFDLLRGGAPVEWSRPNDFGDLYPRYRWRKLAANLWTDETIVYRRHFATYLWRQWAARHPDGPHVERLELFMVYRTNLPEYRASSTRMKRLGDYERMV